MNSSEMNSSENSGQIKSSSQSSAVASSSGGWESGSGATAIVMAAGKGTRMKSELPKVLFPVLGRPMIHWVLDALERVGIERILVVVGYRHEDVRRELAGRKGLEFVLQEQQLGTGHAVQMCVPSLVSEPESESRPVLVVAGDSPLVQSSSLSELLEAFVQGAYSCLLGTLVKEDPQGLGRIVRDANGRFERIVEQKDASAQEALLREVNMSTYVFKQSRLVWVLDRLGNNNAQGEYYLTDCPALLLNQGDPVDARAALKDCESLSINTIDELARVEDKMKEIGYRCES
ncbi:MAG: NTP transferase domain-containing protein [Pirellula sp.]